MSKKIRRLSLVLMLLISLIPNSIYAEEQPINLIINGQEIQSDVPLFIENGRTMIPVRLISESLGFDVLFDQNNEGSIIYIRNMQRMKYNPDEFDDNRLNSIRMVVGNPRIQVSNAKHAKEKTVTSEVAPVIVDGRTFIPLRVFAENMAVQIDWDDASRTVIVTDQFAKNLVPESEWF